MNTEKVSIGWDAQTMLCTVSNFVTEKEKERKKKHADENHGVYTRLDSIPGLAGLIPGAQCSPGRSLEDGCATQSPQDKEIRSLVSLPLRRTNRLH